MLDPNTRTLLLDALQPPMDHVFTDGIATTFSLDLLALLTAPLGLAATTVSTDLRSEWSGDTAVTVLRTVRDMAGRLTVFTDAAHIAVPARGEPLFTFLEQAIVPARAPYEHGAFHPKCWALRFAHRDDPDAITYRLLVLTRNLTFDRSLDLVVALEGACRPQGSAQARPAAPVRRFLEALQDMAVQPLATHHGERIARVAEEVGRTDFRAPEPFHEKGWTFLSFGHEGATGRQPFDESAKRRLIISPFLSAGVLTGLSSTPAQAVLISREAELAGLPAGALESFHAVLVPRPALTESDPAEVEEGGAVSVAGGDLHAKCYLEETTSTTASWYVGSANATRSAFERNVEILLRLDGPRKVIGIDRLLPPAGLQLLSRDGDGNGASPALARNIEFVDLWEAYRPAETLPPDGLSELEANQDEADALAAALARLPWRGRVTLETKVTYSLTLTSTLPLPAITNTDVTLRVRPLLLPQTAERPFTGLSTSWEGLSLLSLSAFWALSVRVGRGEQAAVRRCTLYAPLDGAPMGREAAVTRSILSDEPRVIRFLQLLLTSDEDEVTADGAGEPFVPLPGRRGARNSAHGLLELMLRAFSQRPERLKEAGRIIDDLASHDDGRRNLPDGLLEMWQTFRVAADLAEGRRFRGVAS